MRFGFVVPYANAREFTELAVVGERCGWDAVFTWEALWGEHAWVALGAAAMVTERIRLGTLLPALSDQPDTGRHRPGPDELMSVVADVRKLRAAAGLADAPYDVIVEADSSGEFLQLDPPEPAAWAAAGTTWWIESWWSVERGPDGLTEVRRRVEAGPPS